MWLACVTATAADQPSPALPLEPGNIWIYRGTRKTRTNPASLPPVFRTEPIELQVRVEQVARRDGFTGALIRGFPFDLHQPGSEPGVYGIVESAGKVYLIRDPQRAANVVQRIRERQGPLSGLVLDAEAWFQEPLTVGNKVCEMPAGGYCWNVTTRRPFAPASVKGAGTIGGFEYELEYRANDGYSLFRIVPGIGITRFSFELRCASCGDQAAIRLVEFRKGSDTAR